MVKIGFFLLHRKTLIEQMDVLNAVYRQNNFINPECNCVLDCAKTTYRLFKYLHILNSICTGLLMLWPAVDYLWFGKFHTIFHHFLFGANSSTSVGLVMSVMYEIVECIVHALLFVYFAGICTIYAFNVWVFSGLITHQINQLNRQLENEETATDTLCIMLTFRNVIKMHIEMIR